MLNHKFHEKKILIADDEELIREVFRDQLELLGAEVTLVGNGQEAFQALQLRPFDVLLSDIRMPDGDRFNHVKDIFTSRRSPRPIIFLCSGYSDVEFEEAKQYGVAEIFSKPFNLKQVCATIGSYLS